MRLKMNPVGVQYGEMGEMGTFFNNLIATEG